MSADPAATCRIVGDPLEATLAACAARVAALSGWRRWSTGLAAGALSALAMPPFFLWPVLLVTLPILAWLMAPSGEPALRPLRPNIDLNSARLRRAAGAGWYFGYGFHVAGLYWLREAFLITGGGLGELWPLGVLGLPAGLALFHAAATAAATSASRPGLSRVLALAIALGVSEWLRGNILTGFPWNVLGFALSGPMTLMQTTGLVGIYGLTSITVLALAGPLMVLAAAPAASLGASLAGKPAVTPLRLLAAGLLLAPLTLMSAYGSWRLSIPPPPMLDGVRLRLVQPGIPQRDKWIAARQPEILRRHLDLSARNAQGQTDGMAGITHVVWPEAAMPFVPLQRPEVLAAIGETLPPGVHLIAGILRLEKRDGETNAFNALAVFDGDGKPVAVYDKTHLVPFGEYLPFHSLLEGIGLQALTRQRGGFTSGREPRPLLDVGPLAGIGPLICYEGIFPGIRRRSIGRPSLMLNITNDGWFGNSTGPRQHFHQARLRSVEEGVPLMRIANNGITAVFDPYGRELARLELDIAGVVDTSVPHSIALPLYARLGDLTFAALLGLLFFAFLYTHKIDK